MDTLFCFGNKLLVISYYVCTLDDVSPSCAVWGLLLHTVQVLSNPGTSKSTGSTPYLTVWDSVILSAVTMNNARHVALLITPPPPHAIFFEKWVWDTRHKTQIKTQSKTRSMGSTVVVDS